MNNKVFAGGLPWHATEQHLISFMENAGEITEAKVILDRETGRSRGFGFVTFANSEAASKAVEMYDGQELDGRTIKVNIAEDRRKRQPYNPQYL